MGHSGQAGAPQTSAGAAHLSEGFAGENQEDFSQRRKGRNAETQRNRVLFLRVSAVDPFSSWRREPFQLEAGVRFVDGCEIRKVTGRSLHLQMGMVQQQNFLFTGTVMEIANANHLLKREDRPRSELNGASALSGYGDEVPLADLTPVVAWLKNLPR